MAVLFNYIQVVIRGLYNGQQWQVSPCYGIDDIDGVTDTGGFTFIESSLSNWFTTYWNGWGTLPTNGLSDKFVDILPETALINEVRVYAKTNTMAAPAQAIITGELNGTRGGATDGLPSFTAVSAYARSLTYGRKGASMRLPFLIEGDTINNEITEASRSTFQAGFFDPLTTLGTEAAVESGFVVYNPATDEVANVVSMKPVAVQRVNDPATGKPTFPYEGFANVSAVECAGWTLNPWVSTQNSRKIGRGR